ncbi:MAG: ribonuclease HI [Hydrogenibacillus sp.]|nr:ribonuclease HI [Hydrogenibacillus sp.]
MIERKAGAIDVEAGKEEREVIIYTDGACSGNPGPGGWAALLRYGEHERVLTGGAVRTTNNRMELTAVIEALRALKRPSKAVVYSDSAYVVNAFRQGWLKRWAENGWRKRDGGPVENRDLWEALLRETEKHAIRWEKVRGHADDALNNRVDQLAVSSMAAYRRRSDPSRRSRT